MRRVCKRLRARFAAQKLKKRQVTASADVPMDEPLEEEKAFNEQVNRSDTAETVDAEATPET